MPQLRREDFENDEEWLKAEEKEWELTNDGKNKLPHLQMLTSQYKNINYQYDICALFIDTEHERKIGSGLKYPFPKLNEGECIIHKEMAESLYSEVGDVIFLQFDAKFIFSQLVSKYV